MSANCSIAALEAERLARLLNTSLNERDEAFNEELMLQAEEAHTRIAEYLAAWWKSREYRYGDWVRNKHNWEPTLREVNEVRRQHGRSEIKG